MRSLPRLVIAMQRLHKLAEARAASLEVSELVVAGAGRREQDSVPGTGKTFRARYCVLQIATMHDRCRREQRGAHSRRAAARWPAIKS